MFKIASILTYVSRDCLTSNDCIVKNYVRNNFPIINILV